MKSLSLLLLLIFLPACTKNNFGVMLFNNTKEDIKTASILWDNEQVTWSLAPRQSTLESGIPHPVPRSLTISWETASGKHSTTTNISKLVPAMSEGTIHVIFEEGDRVAIKYEPPLKL